MAHIHHTRISKQIMSFLLPFCFLFCSQISTLISTAFSSLKRTILVTLKRLLTFGTSLSLTAKLVFVVLVIGLLSSFCQANEPIIIALDDLSQEWPEEDEWEYYENKWGLAGGIAVSEKLAEQTAIKQTVSTAAAYFGFQMVTCSKTGRVVIPQGLITESGDYRITLKGEYDVGCYNYGWGLFSGHFGAYRLSVGIEEQLVPVVDRPPTLSDFADQVISQFAEELLLLCPATSIADTLLNVADIVQAASAFERENGAFEIHNICFIDAQKDCEIRFQSRSECAVDCIGLASHFLLLETIADFNEITIEGPLIDTPPRLEVRPTHLNREVNFRQVSVGNEVSVILELSNVGGGILAGYVEIDQTDSVFHTSGDMAFSLSGNSSANINLSFAPDDVATFTAELLIINDQGENIQQIHLCGAGIAPIIESSDATSLNTYVAHPGETIMFQYEISSPFDTETDAWLGATIRHHEMRDFWQSDGVHDKPIQLEPGLSTHLREFTLSDDALLGRYDVMWGIHSGSIVGAGTIWHILPRWEVLEIRGFIEAEASVDEPYYEPGETAVLTVNCTDHSDNSINIDTVTYTVKQGDKVFQGPSLCSPTIEVGQYQANIDTQDLDRGLYTVSTIIVKSGYTTATANTVLNVGLQEVDLVIEPDSVYITASEGTNPTYTLAVLNGGWQTMNIYVSESGQLADWISLPESQFTLSGESSRSYSFTVNVPLSTSEVYTGTLTFTVEGRPEMTETIDMTLKITSFVPGDYFDRICDGGTVDSSTIPPTEYSCILPVTTQDLEAWTEGFVFAGIYACAGDVERQGIVQLFVNEQYTTEDNVEQSGQVCEWIFWTVDVLDTSNTFVLKAKPGEDVCVHYDSMEFRIKFFAGDPDLRTTKEVDKQTLYVGETATVTVTIENVGSNVGNVLYAPGDPRFSDSLPDGLDFVSGSLYGSIHEFLPAPEPGSVDEFQYVFQTTAQGTYVLPAFIFPYEKKPYDGIAEYESQSNAPMVTVLLPQPPELQVQINGLADVYNQKESMSGLSIYVSSDGQGVDEASIFYAIKSDGDEVLSGYSTTNSEGQFIPDDINAPVIPGQYSMQAMASKVGYTDGESSSSFTVRDSTPPTIPVLVSPMEGQILEHMKPTFDWLDSIDAEGDVSGYELQVDSNEDFNSLEIDVSVSNSSYTVCETLYGGDYYWRVRAIDNTQNHSEWSSVCRFKIEILPNRDLFRDGIVNSLDFGVLARYWLATCSEPNWCEGSDLDWSGQTALPDLQILVEAWLAKLESPWPMFHHDLHLTGRSPYLGAQTNNLKWTFTTGGAIYSSPAIDADGTIYIGSQDGSLYAIYPDGSLKWSYPTGDMIRSSPAIGSDGIIYFGSCDNKVYALNPDSTLKSGWPFTTGGDVDSSPSIGSDGTIYVGSDDHKLYAINPDGTPKGGNWPFSLEDIGDYHCPSIADDGTIYFASRNLHAINPDGTEKWSSWLGTYHYFSSAAIADDGTIYIGTRVDNKLHAINPENGDKNWSYLTSGWADVSPSIGTDGTIYIGCQDDKLYGIKPDGTLKPGWPFTTGGDVNSSPAIGADGTIYIGSDDHKLYAINPDGTLKWSYTTGDMVRSSPAIDSDGTVYVSSYDGKLYAFGFTIE
jgi:uncharacterized repeat protein (TIGR01451 family)